MTRRCPACGSEGDVLVEATAILRLPGNASSGDLKLEVVSMIEFNDDAVAVCPAGFDTDPLAECGYTGPLSDWKEAEMPVDR